MQSCRFFVSKLRVVVLLWTMAPCLVMLSDKALGASTQPASTPTRLSSAPSASQHAGALDSQPQTSDLEANQADDDSSNQEINILYAQNLCPFKESWNINLLSILFDYFDDNPGSLHIDSIADNTLGDGQRYLFPDTTAHTDSTLVAHFLRNSRSCTSEIIETNLPVLISPWEINFQLAYKDHQDWLNVIQREATRTSRFSDVVRKQARLVRYSNSEGQSILALEFEGVAPLSCPGKIEQFVFMGSALSSIVATDSTVQLVSIGHPIGLGQRVQGELSQLRKRVLREKTLAIHPGYAFPRHQSLASTQLCADVLEAQQLDALVPSANELTLGPEAFAALVANHKLAFVAANLQPASSASNQQTYVPRYVLKKIRGLEIAIIGVVGQSEINALSATQGKQWQLTDPRMAVEQSIRDIQAQLGHRPDLTVLLATVSGDEYEHLRSVNFVDVIFKNFGSWDLVAQQQNIVVDREQMTREQSRLAQALMLIDPNGKNIGWLTAKFLAKPNAPRRQLLELGHKSWPVLPWGPVEQRFLQRTQNLSLQMLTQDSKVLVPDLTAYVEKKTDLHPLIWGPKIALQYWFRDYPRPYPARFTDPLWMRLICNSMQHALVAEVALAKNIARTSDVPGALPAGVVEQWTPANESVYVAQVDGKRLLDIVEYLQRQNQATQEDASEIVFTTGVDIEHKRVHGRSIDSKEHYRVALTDSTLTVPGIAELLKGLELSKDFSKHNDVFHVDEQGKALSLRELVVTQIQALRLQESRSQRQYQDNNNAHLFDTLLIDTGAQLNHQWSLRLDELSAQASGHRGDNLSVFAQTRETRALTPNLFSLGLKANTALLYDGPWLAWETRLRAEYNGLFLDIEGQDIPPQEQIDDVVLFTELRANKVQLSVAEQALQIIPYTRVTVDSEFSATLDPTQTTTRLPHQALLLESVGLVSFPGAWLPELRLGAVIQHDFSTMISSTNAAPSAVFNDFGIETHVKLSIPLWKLRLDSENDLRYFVPDSDDRAIDLALRVHSANKLLVPMGDWLSVFAMADVYVFSGKAPPSSVMGLSALFGIGLQASHIAKF